MQVGFTRFLPSLRGVNDSGEESRKLIESVEAFAVRAVALALLMLNPMCKGPFRFSRYWFVAIVQRAYSDYAFRLNLFNPCCAA